MNNKETILEVSKKTGLEVEICEKIMKAFEKQSEDSLMEKFKGIKSTKEDKILGISEKSGYTVKDCKIVVDELEKILSNSLSNKLRFKKR